MLRDESISTNDDNSTWPAAAASPSPWRHIDRKLRVIAKKRSALYATEAQLLLEAETLEIWSEYGYVSIFEYMERVLGYGPKAAHDRLRVARELDGLPLLTQALARDELKFSAIRELTRVAIPRTERAWRDKAIGRSLREIEAMVAGRKKGDLPTDPADPDLSLRTLRFEVTPATYALFLQAQQALEHERGARLNDDQIMAAMARASLDSGTAADAPTRARFQISITQCDKCRQGWQQAAGKEIAIHKRAMDRAECDAQWIGSVDATRPARTVQPVPPRTRKLVWVRDHGRCRVPGCRSSRFLEVHHILHRVDGGDNSPRNLLILCDGHHLALHEGKLQITGSADNLELSFTFDPHREVRDDVETLAAHVGPNSVRASATTSNVPREGGRSDPEPRAASRDDTAPADATIAAIRQIDDQAASALVSAGCKNRQAKAAVEAARSHVGADAPLEKLVFEAFRRCVWSTHWKAKCLVTARSSRSPSTLPDQTKGLIPDGELALGVSAEGGVVRRET
ncbi:MAG: endonuclease [Myxococcales bacterium]|nr:endonuclease [Myxococcales bacterium]